MDEKTEGSLIKSFLLGLFSGAIASPCITPALAVLLTLVAEKGNPVLGFFALFLFALGMGVLLIFVGTFSTMLNLLPVSGVWMLEIKNFFGWLILAMCVYFSKSLLNQKTSFILYLLIFGSFLIYWVIKILRIEKKHTH